MKQIYYRYRKVLKNEKDDPFVMNTVQFWCFARDFKFITPSCSLARINRFLLGGVRRHSEMCPDDMGIFQTAFKKAEKEGAAARAKRKAEEKVAAAAAAGDSKEAAPPSPKKAGEASVSVEENSASVAVSKDKSVTHGKKEIA